MTERDESLNTWTIYFSPLDAPGKYILRRFEITAGETTPREAYQSDDIEPLRDLMRRRGLYRLARDPNDHESVVETWI